MLRGAFTGYLMAATLAAPLLFAPPAARAQNELRVDKIVECKFLKGAVSVRRDICVDMVSVAVNMQKLGTTDFTHAQLVKVCEVELYMIHPGEDPAAYTSACEGIYGLTF